MNYSYNNFIFKGFSPSDDFKIYCKEIYNLLEENTPGRSTKIACISKTANKYEGTLRIISNSGIFKVKSKHIKPKPLIDELYQEMSLQILDWVETRDY